VYRNKVLSKISYGFKGKGCRNAYHSRKRERLKETKSKALVRGTYMEEKAHHLLESFQDSGARPSRQSSMNMKMYGVTVVSAGDQNRGREILISHNSQGSGVDSAS
jgi:hypothetical protein